MLKSILFSCGLLIAVQNVSANTIAKFDFNSAPPDGAPTTGTNVPSVGMGLASLVGGTTATFSDGSTNDPASSADDSGWNTTHYPAQGTSNKTAGVQFTVGTSGYSNIMIRWDQRVTGSAHGSRPQ